MLNVIEDTKWKLKKQQTGYWSAKLLFTTYTSYTANFTRKINA